jgi:hypothetical protein
LAALVGEKRVLYPPHEAPLVQQAFRARGLEHPRASVATLSFHRRYMLLMTGDYLTVIPASMLPVFNAKRPTGKPLPIVLGVQAGPVAIFTLNNRTLSPVAALFVKCVRIAARAMAS